MRKALLLLAVALAGNPALSEDGVPLEQTKFTEEELEAAQRNPGAFEIDPSRVRLTYIGRAGPDEVPPGPEPRSVGTAAIDPWTIINIGKEVWRIIEANRPVVDIKQSFATAMPGGTTHWSQLTGWSPAAGDVYELEAGNFWGWTVIKVRFQVLRISGGTYGGVGKYLTMVTTEPQLVEVFWGYRFSMEGEVPKETVLNAGGPGAPLGALTHKLKWRINTAIKEMRGSHVYYMQGDGVFRQIGSPNIEPGPARHFRLPEDAPRVPAWE